MKFPVYPEYKKSFSPWLGKIPKHWIIDRLKWTVLDCQNGVWGEEPNGESDIVCIRVADFDRNKFIVNKENLTFRFIKDKDKVKKLLKKGDLLLEKSGGGEKQLVGAVILFNEDFNAVSSNFIARMSVANNFNSRFLTYLHAHLYYSKVNYRSIKQTTGIQNLDSQQYLNERIAFPSPEEQKTIAAFLDYKTKQIDELIEKKEQLLKLLEEKRIALITHAVTKGLPAEARVKAGLDPNVKLKPSGIDWLGDIPEHWDVKRLRFLADVNPSKSELELNIEETVSFVPMDAVGEYGGIRLDEIKTVEDVYNGYTYFKDGDIIIAKITPCFENGKGAIAEKLENSVAFGTTELYILRTKGKLNNKFLLYITFAYHFRNYGESEMFGAGGQKRVPENFIKDFLIVYPSLTEQESIIKDLESNLEQIDLLKKSVLEAVNKLKEYRTALITAAVTGKIDLRNWQNPSLSLPRRGIEGEVRKEKDEPLKSASEELK